MTPTRKSKYKYAAGTSVPVSSSMEEIRKYLVERMGAEGYAPIYLNGHEFIRFQINGIPVQMKVPDWAGDEREHKRVWRVMLLHVKSMWESLQNRVASLEEIVLPYVLLPTGRTLGEELPTRLHAAIQAGKMPLLLLPGVEGEGS